MYICIFVCIFVYIYIYICSVGEQMWGLGKGEYLIHNENVPAWSRARNFGQSFYFPTVFFWYHIKEFERVLKIPSNFPFNKDKFKRSSADQPLVHWLIWESRFDPMNGFYCLIPFQKTKESQTYVLFSWCQIASESLAIMYHFRCYEKDSKIITIFLAFQICKKNTEK